jgi:hypothetical protein
MGINYERLKIFKRVPAGGKNVSLDIHPESQDKIDDQGRSHRKEGNVNKPGTDTGSGNAHLLPDRRTYAKYLPFDKVLQSVHTSNLEKNDTSR